MIKRRRFKQSKPLKERLLEELHAQREAATGLPAGSARDAALRKARHAEAAAHMDDWLNSPGLRPPKHDIPGRGDAAAPPFMITG